MGSHEGAFCDPQAYHYRVSVNLIITADILWAGQVLRYLLGMWCMYNIRECSSTLYVGMPQKQNGLPIHCIAKLITFQNYLIAFLINAWRVRVCTFSAISVTAVLCERLHTWEQSCLVKYMQHLVLYNRFGHFSLAKIIPYNG